MEVGSAENGFDEISDLLKDDESTLPEDLDLDISVDFIYDNDSGGYNKFNFHPSDQEQSELPSLSYNLGCHDIPRPCIEKFHSFAQHGSHSDGLPNKNVVHDQKLHFLPQGDLYHQDAHKLCGGYLGKTALKMDAESANNEVLEDACPVPEGFVSVQEHGLEGDIIDMPDTVPHAAIGGKTFLEALEQELNQVEFTDGEEEKHGVPLDQIQNIHSPNLQWGDPKSKRGNADDSINNPDASKRVDSAHADQHEQSRTLQLSVSPVTSREISVPLETSLRTHHVTDDHRLSASTGHGDVSYPNTPDQIYGQSEGCSQNGDIPHMDHSIHAGKQNSASSQGSGQTSQHGEDSSDKSVATTGNHNRKRSRSLSMSPRQRNRSSSSKRDCCTNPQMGSPFSRESRKRSSDKVICFHQFPRNHNMPVPQSYKKLSYTSRSHKPKHDLARSSRQGREVTCKDHLLETSRQKPSCQHEPRERFLNGSSSPINHHSHHNHKKMGRSISPSPVRRRNIFSGNNRERNKSRPRSPYGRNRKGYSQRHISPGWRYSSRYRSHQIRCLSPASYRRTGIGKPGTCLFVAGFGFLTTERELERKFSRFGRVRNVRIIRDKRSGISRGYGFLSLERDGEADAAIRALHRVEWNGRVVLVEKSISN